VEPAAGGRVDLIHPGEEIAELLGLIGGRPAVREAETPRGDDVGLAALRGGAEHGRALIVIVTARLLGHGLEESVLQVLVLVVGIAVGVVPVGGSPRRRRATGTDVVAGAVVGRVGP